MTFKVSYSCMPSMQNAIDSHNASIKQVPQTDEKKCNCRNKDQCPLNGECRAHGIVYLAKVIADDGQEQSYVGLADTEFKSRYANHTHSFRNPTKKNATELSKFIWALKDKNIDHKIMWEILGKTSSYSNISKKCNLCISEKYFIICHPEKSSLNKRSELISTCRHSRKFLFTQSCV